MKLSCFFSWSHTIYCVWLFYISLRNTQIPMIVNNGYYVASLLIYLIIL